MVHFYPPSPNYNESKAYRKRLTKDAYLCLRQNQELKPNIVLPVITDDIKICLSHTHWMRITQ